MKGGGDGNTQWGKNYTITGNQVLNANTASSTTVNTGFGIGHHSAIMVQQGIGVTITGNTLSDNRPSPLQQYGIEIGQSSSPSAQNQPDYVTVANNTILGTALGKINRLSSTFTSNYQEVSDNLFLANLFFNNNTGRLGIGTSTPLAALGIANGDIKLDLNQRIQWNNSSVNSISYDGTALRYPMDAWHSGLH